MCIYICAHTHTHNHLCNTYMCVYMLIMFIFDLVVSFPGNGARERCLQRMVKRPESGRATVHFVFIFLFVVGVVRIIIFFERGLFVV